MKKRGKRLGFFVLVVLGFVWIYTNAVEAAIVVSHDINTLSSSRAGNQEEMFAVNVATFLTVNSNTDLLLFESYSMSTTTDFSAGIVNALGVAGFNVTVTDDYTTSFSDFDAIFVAQGHLPVAFLDNGALISYVDNGGGVYLAGGSGNVATEESAGWATFLNHFGLAFDTSYNGINDVTITGGHAIFTGISDLRSGNGQSIIDLGTNPNAEIVQFSGGQAVYAVVSSVPLPPALLLFGSSLIGLLGIKMRRGK